MVERLGLPVVATDVPVNDVGAGSVLDAVSSLVVSDSLSEEDSADGSETDRVGSAEDSESLTGPVAVGRELSVEMVKVGKSCAATLETPIIAEAARSKRADGDMRRDTIERIVRGFSASWASKATPRRTLQ